MEVIKKHTDLIVGVNLCVILMCVTVGFVYIRLGLVADSTAYRVLHLLYVYDDFESEIVENNKQLRSLVSEEVWNQLNIDNEYHTVSNYFKLAGAKTELVVVLEQPGIIVYHILNENVDASLYWVFRYTEENGVLTSVQEYQLNRYLNGSNGGVW